MLAVWVRLLANRTKNLLQAEFNYALSYLGIMRFTHLPTFVSVEPANFCQLHCPECPVGMCSHEDKENKLLTIEQFRHILDAVQNHVHTIQFYFQGEPLLNHDLAKMIRMAHDVGLYTIVSTNAQNLTAKLAKELVYAGLSRIIVSMDGLSEESYGAYRIGGNLHKTLSGLGYLKTAKLESGAHIHIELQCLKLRTNEHEWPLLKRSYKKMGADSLTLKTAQFYDIQQGNPLMPSSTRDSRYYCDDNDVWHVKRRVGHVCRRVYMGIVVDVDGNVRPCCFDKGGKYILGNLLTQSLTEIWNSDRAKHFREAVLHHRKSIDICQNCTE